jgi:hypothetical protein
LNFHDLNKLGGSNDIQQANVSTLHYDYCPFRGPFAKKTFFDKEEFSNEIF